MRKSKWKSCVLLMLVLALAGGIWVPPVSAQTADETAGETQVADADGQQEQEDAELEEETEPQQRAVTRLQGVSIHRQQGYIEFEARVVFEEGDWVELLACSPNTLEYESLMVSRAEPSHVHFGLIMLGLKPGSPMQHELVGDRYVTSNPWGPVVAISFLVRDDQGKWVVTPANEWIVDQETGKQMPSNRWLFVGSQFTQVNEREVYLADLNGTLITLANFSDEVIVQAETTVTNRGGGPIYNADPKKLPKPGTTVKIRISKTDEIVNRAGQVVNIAKPKEVEAETQPDTSESPETQDTEASPKEKPADTKPQKAPTESSSQE